MFVRIMHIRCSTCVDGLRVMERDRKEETHRGDGLPPTYLPTIQNLFRDRHFGSGHSITVSETVIESEI